MNILIRLVDSFKFCFGQKFLTRGFWKIVEKVPKCKLRHCKLRNRNWFLSDFVIKNATKSSKLCKLSLTNTKKLIFMRGIQKGIRFWPKTLRYKNTGNFEYNWFTIDILQHDCPYIVKIYIAKRFKVDSHNLLFFYREKRIFFLHNFVSAEPLIGYL